MSTSWSLVTPYRFSDEQRHEIAEWCWERWRLTHSPTHWRGAWRGSGQVDDGPFNRSRAVNCGVAAATSDVVVIADADIAVRHGRLDAMLTALDEGAPWVIGYERFVQANDPYTAALLRHPPEAKIAEPVRPFDIHWQSRSSVCGLLAFRRDDFVSIGGFDERHEDWGSEDVSFACAATTLLGPVVRVPGDCVHLRHPQRPDRKVTPAAKANKALERRYLKAAGDAGAMRELIAEGATI